MAKLVEAALGGDKIQIKTKIEAMQAAPFARHLAHIDRASTVGSPRRNGSPRLDGTRLHDPTQLQFPPLPGMRF